MTEAEWLTCADPGLMLSYLHGNVTDRKVRLFACGCVRQVWDLMPDEDSRAAVAATERFADGLLRRSPLNALRFAARSGNMAAVTIGRSSVAEAVYHGRREAHETSAPGSRFRPEEFALCPEQADLLRHLVGNPFSPPLLDLVFPIQVRQLAEALYEGQSAHFALHDALQEAGHTNLADHFAAPQHPRGCWALDLILGKA